MTPKDKDNKCQKSGIIYRFQFPHRDCLEAYTGESGRSFGDRLKEHLMAPFPIHHHSHIIGHSDNLECFTIVDRESQGVNWTRKEAMSIAVNDPCLNRKLGKCQLPHIWDMRYYWTPHHCSSSKATPAPPAQMGIPHPIPHFMLGTHKFFI